MSVWTVIYTIALSSASVYPFRFESLYKKILLFGFFALFVNLRFIQGLSIGEWAISLLGEPSLFLLFLSLSACFVIFWAPNEEILPLKVKFFIAILGFVVFFGNMNVLWGVDFFNLGFYSQLVVVLGILFFAFAIDVFFGLLYLLCLCVVAFGLQENIFLYLIDVSVWIYALFWIVIDGLFKRKVR